MQSNHPLKKYRIRNDLSLEALAQRVGVNRSTLSKIENRHQYPSMVLAARLKEATGGAVTPNDFISTKKSR